MLIKPHDSDSAAQRTLEETIIIALKGFQSVKDILGDTNFENRTFIYEKNDLKVSFQFDFFNESRDIFGEIYACKFPLKSGHVRKIKGDVLKLLTIEKLLGKTLNKFIVLTVESQSEGLEPGIYTSTEISKFGKSWFTTSLEQFGVQLLYFVMSTDDSKLLNDARTLQAKGMKS